ncbi:DHH family phosphoesterase [Haloimpatiens sp. FM7330]|uniref:DHH family phosphoesterase n=1 Tax=Haloimpatiens sp. FM7330 TaxID=3298610 RepID=UPI00363B9545
MNMVNDKRKELELNSPFLFRDMKNSLDRIVKAVNRREKIVIYGHYDLDCITGVSLLILVLRYLNADVEYYISSDPDNNYEISLDAVESHIKFLGAGLIITVGCGINSSYEIEMCKRMNIDVIVTDFHKPKKEIPETYVINCLQCKYNKFNELTAVGITFKLAQAIAEYYKIKCIDKYMDLVMLGIVSKNIPLSQENELFVMRGVKQLKVTNNYGIKALMKVHKICNINTSSVLKLVNTVMPTVNPIGKMDNAKIVVELFITSNSYRAEQIAKYLKKQVENDTKLNANPVNQVINLRNFTKKLKRF